MGDRLDQSLGRLVLRQFKEFWWVYLLALTAMFFTHFFQVELPFIAKELGELVLGGQMEKISYGTYFLIALGIIFFRTSSRALFFWPARVLQGKLQEELMGKIEQSSPWRYRSYSSGQIYQLLVNDLMNMRAFIGFALLQVGNIVIAVSILVPRLADFNSKLLLAFTPIIVCMGIFFLLTSYSQKFYKRMVDIQGDVQNFIIETYEGKKSIKNFQAEDSFIQLFEGECRKELGFFFKGAMGPVFSIPLMRLGIGLTFLWGAYIIYSEKLGSTSLILFSGFVFLFQGPLMFTSWIGVVFSRTFGSWQRIKKMVKTLQTESLEEKNIHRLNEGQKHFNMVLWEKKSSFLFHPQGLNVISGETGAGKSTLLLHYATRLKSEGRNISYVAQQPYLYSDTVSSNIFLGREPDPKKVKTVHFLLDLFQLGILGKNFSSIMAMEVGENGKRVSGGQAKRICLIRSLISESDTVIWDDPFSSVDLISEKEIMTALQKSKLLAHKTILLTSHRLSTVKLSDYIFHIAKDDGLVESGPVKEILKKKTKVYEYFKEQMV
ncbi:MAG: ABC transporter ATP-binding protein [Bacteriovoracales bacterium]|nr:ABC transporter ATP-binding protein [Bacteriovoracales bacterium]